MTRQAATILTCITPRLTPTAVASMLVANAVATKPSTPPRAWGVFAITGSGAGSSPLKARRIILPPIASNRPKAIQWSTAAIHVLSASPRTQPITGVMASKKPKTAPIRTASFKRAFCSTAPLPTAAAKASTDRLRPRTPSVKIPVIRIPRAARNTNSRRNPPATLGVSTAVGLAWRFMQNAAFTMARKPSLLMKAPHN